MLDDVYCEIGLFAHRELQAQYRFFDNGDELQKIMANPSISDSDVYTYLKAGCQNIQSLLEGNGKRLAHIAAATGRNDLIEMLNAQRACLSSREQDFGFTPLHFSLRYGQIHTTVRLIQWGCNIEKMDDRGRLAFDLGYDCKSKSTDLFVWGSNTNYTLGSKSDREVQVPEPSDFFIKKNLTVCKVAMGKYHTVFLTHSGVYFCGLGSCVGNKYESPFLIPCEIPIIEGKIIDISVGEHHTLLLNDRCRAYSCGKNTSYALGFSDNRALVSEPVQLLVNLPRETPVSRICAGPQHTVIVSNYCVYTCGNNLGQLGLTKEAKFGTELHPIYLKVGYMRVTQVAACLEATVFTTYNHLFILANFEREKIEIPDNFNFGLDVSCVSSTDRFIVAIGAANNVYVWNSNTKVFFKCVFPHAISIASFKFNPNGCIILTKSGRGFFGSFSKVDTEQKLQWMEYERIAHINHGREVWCDPQGRNFGVLQRSLVYPERESLNCDGSGLYEVRRDLCTMFDEAYEEDFVHDVLIKVQGETIPAHSCILFHPRIKTAIEKFLNGKADQKTFNVDTPASTFRQCLRYIYNPSWPCEPTLLQKCANIDKLANQAVFDGIDRETGDFLLISDDKVKFRVHKCVLIARMEYFKAILSNAWQGKPLKELQVQVDGTLLSAFIDVMYTGTSSFFINHNLDILTVALKKADEYLFDRFKMQLENCFINLVSLRNAAKILVVAVQYNARVLLEYLYMFITFNLSTFLEARTLEILSDDELIGFSDFYKRLLVDNIEKNADGSLVEKVRAISKEYSLAVEKEAKKGKTGSETKKRRSRTSSETINSSIEEAPDSIPQKPEETTELTSAANSIQTIQRRLKVITESLHSSLPDDSFTLLGKNFPELNSAPRPIPTPKSSPDVLSKKFTRRSQRDRKRLTSTGSTGDESQDVASPPQSPWASLPPIDIISPKSEERLPKIDSIILEEKEERKRIARVVNKPLDLTLMEDQAIRDLEIFYNAGDATEERITVQRLSATVSLPTPVWPPTSLARALW